MSGIQRLAIELLATCKTNLLELSGSFLEKYGECVPSIKPI